MMELVSRRDEGVLSLQEATPTIRAILVRQAKLERARQHWPTPSAGPAPASRWSRWPRQFNAPRPAGRAVHPRRLRAGPRPHECSHRRGVRAAPGETSPLVEAEQQLFLIRAVAHARSSSRAEWQAQVMRSSAPA
jgi:hypothetical protein